MDTLQDIVLQYLKENGMTIKYFAMCIDTEYSSAHKWLHKLRKLDSSKMMKIHEFLEGKHLKSATKIMKEGE